MALQILIRGRRSILFYRRETEAQRRPGTAAHPGLHEQENQAMGWGFSICCRALGPPMLPLPSAPTADRVFLYLTVRTLSPQRLHWYRRKDSQPTSLAT